LISIEEEEQEKGGTVMESDKVVCESDGFFLIEVGG